MNKSNFLKTLEEKPLRMVPLPQLPPRPQIVVRKAAPAQTSGESPLPAIVIVGLAFWLVYAFLRGVQA